MRVDLRKLETLASPIIERSGCELVDVKFIQEQGRSILRVLLDREGGIRVEHCEQVSRELNTLLDVEGVIPGSYMLEVSSPGPRRPLKSEAHFARFVGAKIELETKEPINGRRNYKGFLQGIEKGQILMEIDKCQYQISYEDVNKAYLIK